MLTLVRTELRSNGWTRYFFKDNEGYEFFIQKANEERIREKVKNPNHPVGKAYQQEGLTWEIRNREIIDSSPQQVAEGCYNLYKNGEIPESRDSLIKRLEDEIISLQGEIDRLKQEKADIKKSNQGQLKELAIILFPSFDPNGDINVSFSDLKTQAEKKEALIIELEEELDIEMDHAKNMDNWYQRLLKEEKEAKLLIEKENERLKRKVQELEAKVEVPPSRF